MVRNIKLILTTVFISLGIVFLSNCNKAKTPKGTPKCIKTQIKAQRKNTCLSYVYQYQYNGIEVYYFEGNSSCVDNSSVLYDENCNIICDFGGISGSLGNSCPDFYKNRTNEKLIWKR